MVAARDLKAGEVLFRECSVVHGPKMLSHPICLGCHKSLPIKTSKAGAYRCSRCEWPMCSKSCEGLDPHMEECKLMASKNYKCPIKTNCAVIQSDAIYCLIFPLRLLLLKRAQPKMWGILRFILRRRWKHFRDFCFSLSYFALVLGIGNFNFRFEKILSELESHVDERIASGSYEALKVHLVPFVQKLLGAKDYPERLILTSAAILDNNCFEISMPLRGVEMGGLFLLSLILCHDCVPNTKHFVNHIEAAVDIQRYQMTFQTTGTDRKVHEKLLKSCSLQCLLRRAST